MTTPTVGQADAGKEGAAAHDPRWRDLGIAGAQMRLHGVKRRVVDQRRHLDGDDVACGFERLVLSALVELVPAHIDRPRQDAVDLPDAPAPAVAGEDATLVEMGRDVSIMRWNSGRRSSVADAPGRSLVLDSHDVHDNADRMR
jgi:hypothetical protein